MGIFDTPDPTYANLASSSQTSYAPWYENAAQGAYSGLSSAVANANALSAEGYQGPGGAGLNPSLNDDQTNAFGMVRANQGAWRPGFAQAGQFLQGAQGRLGQTYNPNGIATGQWGQQADVDRYMNPYIQNVLDVGARKLNTNFDIQQTRANDQATMSGAFGGSRHGVLQGQIEKNRGEAVGDLYTTGLANAYQNAQGMFTSDQGRGLTAQTADEAAKARAAALGLQAGQLGLQGTQIAQQMGVNAQNAGLTDSNALLSIGNQQYAREQTGIQNYYNDWLRRQNQPVQNAQALLNGLGSVRAGQSTTGTSQQAVPGVSTASQIGGLATAGLGGLGLLNSAFSTGQGSTYQGGISNIASGIGNVVRDASDWIGSLFGGGGGGSGYGAPLFSRGGRVANRGLGFARGGFVDGIRRYAMGGSVVGQQIQKPGIMAFAEGGSLDDAYMGESTPIDWQQESASEFEGQPIGPTMDRLQRVFDNAASRGDGDRARAVANVLKTLYPARKQFGDNYIIGTDPRTQQVEDPRPTVQQVLGTGQTFGGNQFGGYRPDIVDPMAGVGGGRAPAYEVPPKTGIAPAGPPVRQMTTEPVGIVAADEGYRNTNPLIQRQGIRAQRQKINLPAWANESLLDKIPRQTEEQKTLKAYRQLGIGDTSNMTGQADPEAAPANPNGAAVAGAGAERQPVPMAGPVDPNTPDDESAPLPEAKPSLEGAQALRRTGSMAGGAGPRPAPMPAAQPSGIETIGPEGGGAYPPGGMVEAPQQKGLGAFVGPSTPAQAPTAEKPFEPLKSGWMPVIQAGLRMMAAKPGQSFVQNLGEAGEAGIKGMEAQVKAAAEEKKLGLEGRKVDLSEREVKVKEGLLPAQQRLYQSHADYYNHQVKTGKMTPIGIDKETGDALFYNTKTDQIEQVPGVTTPQAYTAIMTKQMAMQQAAALRGASADAREDALAERREARLERDKDRAVGREETARRNWASAQEHANKLFADNPMNMTKGGIEKDIEVHRTAMQAAGANPNAELAKRRLEQRIDTFADGKLKEVESAKLSPAQKKIAVENINKQREARKYALGD